MFVTNGVQPFMAIVLKIQDTGRFGVLLNLAVLLTVPLGALISGVVADLCGRRKMYGLELILLIAGIFGLVLTDTKGNISATAFIVFWRMIMGLGIGADYPLSAVITAE
jgi:PHS family inorganic phosphate transporter-like MFS transporter